MKFCHLIIIAIAMIAKPGFGSIQSAKVLLSVVHQETSGTNFVIRSTRFATAEFEDSFGFASNEPRWGGLTSLQFSENGEQWIGTTSQGDIVLSSSDIYGFESITVDLIQTIDEESDEHLAVDSISTISGSPLLDPFLDAYYLRVSSGKTPLRSYQSIDSDTYEGLVFNRPYEDALTLCPESLRQQIASCNGSTLTSIPPQSGQSVGSLLFLCESRSESDGLFHGWACNPSTGDSWGFSLQAEEGWNFVDWSFCSYSDPPQILLLSVNETSFAVDTVLLSALHDDDNQILMADDLIHGRVRLFESSTTSQVRSLSVSRDEYNPEQLMLYLGSTKDDSSGLTSIHVISLNMSPEGTSELSEVNSNSYTLSVIILVLLVTVGIAVPLLLNKLPRLRFMVYNMLGTRSPEPAYLTLNEHRASPAKLTDVSVSLDASPIGRLGSNSNATKPLNVVIE